MLFSDEIIKHTVEKATNHVSDMVQGTGCASVLLESGVTFGFDINRFKGNGKRCLIITDSNGGRVCINDDDAIELYVFLSQFESLLIL